MLSQLPQSMPKEANLITTKNFLLKTFRMTTSRDDLMCFMIKLVNEHGWKANHSQDSNFSLYYIVRNNLAVDQGLLLKYFSDKKSEKRHSRRTDMVEESKQSEKRLTIVKGTNTDFSMCFAKIQRPLSGHLINVSQRREPSIIILPNLLPEATAKYFETVPTNPSVSGIQSFGKSKSTKCSLAYHS
uniref:Uncharacterized protein n=1 Tax=Romanomermis culicivorax TaxID=13658 RepID=A0A915IRB6_ROMCU